MSSRSIIVSPLEVSDIQEAFSDLEPVPQDDRVAVCCIDYQDDFRLAHDYMRAVWKAHEHSDRALRLTVKCLQQNPANYTVWQYRRQCLDEKLASSSSNDDDDDGAAEGFVTTLIANELQLAARIGGDNPKNYQVWHHRRAMLERLLKTSEEEAKLEATTASSHFHSHFGPSELDYINNVLYSDAKNYHAWSYRQWIVQTMCRVAVTTGSAAAVVASEMAYGKSLIVTDIRNNSAWNYLWFFVHLDAFAAIGDSSSAMKKCLEPAVALEQAKYALDQALLDEFNESPWRFLVALVKEQFVKANDPSLLETVLDKLQEIHQMERYSQCNHVLSTLTDLLELRATKADLKQALPLLKQLEVQDMIRKKYWRLRQDQLTAKLS